MEIAKYHGCTASVYVVREGDNYKLVVYNNFRPRKTVCVGIHSDDTVWRAFYLLKAALAEGIPF